MYLTFGLMVTIAASALGAPSKGCGKEHSSGYKEAGGIRTIESSGGERIYGVYVPKSYNEDPNKPRKLILDYHGRGGDPRQQFENTQYSTYEDGEQYLVVYPAGLPNDDRRWQSAWYATNVSDIQFTKDLLVHIQDNYCVDTDHIYASGKSNGGGFVDYLACDDAGDSFAAFAVAAPALYNDTTRESCSKQRAIMSAHGRADSVIKYDGETGKHPLPNVRDWVSWWATRNGCIEAGAKTENATGYQHVAHSCSGKKNVVEHFAQSENGHCWPDSAGDNSDAERDYCKGDRSLDYTRKVLDFFARWNATNAP